jgi:hypothetical protein
MASTITNYTPNIDVQFPVPGADNDTAGFRTNFSNIRDGLTAAYNEISDIQLIQAGIINQLDSVTAPTTINASIVTATTILSADISNTGTITANTISASGNITTNGYFVGDARYLTNISRTDITSVGTLTSLTIEGGDTDATITVNNGNMIISGISTLSFSSTATTTATLVSSMGPGLNANTFTVSSVVGINIGDTFKLYSTETSVHTVFGITTTTNQLTTTPFNPSAALAAGVVAGSNITFNKGVLTGNVSYTYAAPPSSKGSVGDKKGMIFATTANIYVCFADYTFGAVDIWARTATTGQTW